jgi:hypothetical protein
MDILHFDHIDTAFLQLSFAIKLWHFLDEHPIEKEKFDIPLTIGDPGNPICLVHNEFNTYQDLLLAAGNNVSICFGAVAITLWEAIRKHSGLSARKLNPKKSPKENLAALSYMIRCCFAHGTASPAWSIHDQKYKTVYRVGNKTIDLSRIADRQAFDHSSVGGYETVWLIKAAARANGLL